MFFSPDHASDLYADVLRIQVMKNSRVIQLAGKSRKSNVYIKGVEMLTSNLNNESMILTELDSVNNLSTEAVNETENSVIPTAIPILITLYSVSSSKTFGEYSTAEKTISIGCAKTSKSGNQNDKNAKRV